MPTVDSSIIVLTVKYAKTGDMRFFSHLDLIRLFQRAVRRAGIPVALSRGFHTRPEISFGPALKLGKESMNEYARFKLTTPVEPEEFRKMLQEQLPEGIQITEVNANE